MADQTRKQILTADLAAARDRFSGYASALRQDLDVGARLKSGVSANPIAWFGGAAAVGLLLSKIPPLRRKVVVKGPAIRNNSAEKTGKAAVLLTALKFALDFAKPALLSWAKQRLFARDGRGVSTKR